jgi:hypothetical protein
MCDNVLEADGALIFPHRGKHLLAPPPTCLLVDSLLDAGPVNHAKKNKQRTRVDSTLSTALRLPLAVGLPDLLVADVEGCLPFYPQIGPVPAPAANRRDRTIFS